MKPGDLVRDSDGDIGIVVSLVRDFVMPTITWAYYTVDGDLVSDDIDNLEVLNEAR
jgi:hypothetical protein